MTRFSLRPGFVCFSDDRPGSYVGMLDNAGRALVFRNDASSFNDGAHDYTWAFEYTAPVEEGQQFVFHCADREVAGEVRGGEVVVVPKKRPLPVASMPEPPPPSRLVTIGRLPTQRASTKLRILFVNPCIPYNQFGCYRAGTMNEASFSAHGAAYVSATLKAEGHTCWMVDFRALSSWAHIEATLRDQVYDVAFMGFLSIDAFHAAAAVRLLKELHPNRPVVVGGLHVSIAKEKVFPRPDLVDYYAWGKTDLLPGSFRDFLAFKGEDRYISERYPQADYVILDDGEIAARDLVSDLAAGRTPAARTIDGGAVPMEVARHLDRDLFNLEVEAYSPILPFQPTPMVTVTWARGCPFRCSYSVTGDTVVFTDDGPTEVAALMQGVGVVRNCIHGGSLIEHRLDRMIAAPDGRRLATRAIEEGVQPVMRMTTEGGFVVKATPEHRFLCVVGDVLEWRRTDELKAGDFMAVRQPERDWPTEYQRLNPPILSARSAGHVTVGRCPEVLDERLAWLSGFMVGDGCLPSDGRAAFHFCVFPNLEEKQRDIVRDLFDVELKIYDAVNTEKQRHGWVQSRLAREVLEQSVGIDLTDKLKIPSIFWKAPKTVLAAFVDGLYAADAYAPEGGYEYLTTVSERLARDVAYALLMLGRGCPNVQRIDNERGTQWRIGILQNDRIPCTRSIYQSKKSGLWYWRTKKGPNREGIRRRTLRESGLLHALDRDGWYYVRVLTVDACPAEPVYDLTVPDGEAFVANGFVAHNCNLASQLSNTNVRQKPVELVEEELDILHARFGGHIGSLMIHDDLTFHPKHIAQWAELILRKYKGISIWMQTRADWVVTRYRRDREFWELLCKAGLTWTSVGYESGSQRVLDYMRKDNTVENNIECGRILDEYGINSFGNFLWGVPTETNEEADQTVELVRKIRPGFLSGSVYCNYPGTQLDAECREMGHLVEGTVYTTSHLPWQVTIKGIDYPYVNGCVSRAGSYANYLRMPKMLSEERQRELAASARGLPIHGAGEL